MRLKKALKKSMFTDEQKIKIKKEVKEMNAGGLKWKSKGVQRVKAKADTNGSIEIYIEDGGLWVSFININFRSGLTNLYFE